MIFNLIRRALVCLCCVAPLAHAAPIKSSEAWTALLASGQPTPLDALTPYGKREFLAHLRWGQDGVNGFNTAALVRELNADQLASVLALIDAADYLPMLSRRLVGTPLRLADPSPEVERRLLALQKFAKESSDEEASVTRTTSALPQRYDALFKDFARGEALRRQPTEDLPLLFSAAASVDLLLPGAAAYHDLLAIHAELARRGIDTRRDFDQLTLNAMLAARAFEKARAFAASHPPLTAQNIPKVVDPLGAGFQGRSVFQYDAASHTLTRLALPATDKELIMVVDAGCLFSKNALAALHEDPQLAARLRAANLVLITPPASAISLGFVADWNRDNPRIPMLIPYNVQEWRALNVTGVPQFYWFKRHQAPALLAGWPAGGNKDALLKLIEQ